MPRSGSFTTVSTIHSTAEVNDDGQEGPYRRPGEERCSLPQFSRVSSSGSLAIFTAMRRA
jgi:hypothetical protein